MARCYECGDEGHMARSCPNLFAIRQDQERADGKPMWCGHCDRRTRLVLIITADGEKVKRCDCHPESHKLPVQFATCPRCRNVVYQWDTAPCEKHQAVGVHRPYRAPEPTPPRRSESELIAIARQQLAEDRAARIAMETPRSGG